MSLTASEVGVTYPGGRRALDAVSCTIEPGLVTAIVGPNGAGKSTLVRVLAGVRTPDTGGVTIRNRPIRSMPARRRARHIAVVAQQPTVAFDFDARRVVGFGAMGSGNAAGAVDRAIERFGLCSCVDAPFGSLSVGQRQRVSLARAWAQLEGRRDAYLLADEPISAMDPAYARVALGALRELADRGVGVGVVLHDLSSAAGIADRAVLLGAAGRLVAEGPSGSVLTESRLSGVFGTPIVRGHVEGIGVVLAPPTV